MKTSKLLQCLTCLLFVVSLKIVAAQKATGTINVANLNLNFPLHESVLPDEANAFTPTGADCEFDGDCRNSKQWCSFGYCRCKDGLILHENSCYNATYYGQPCVDEAQCQGLFCYPRTKGGPSRCLCGKFGTYNRTTGVCEYDFAHLESLLEREDNRGRIEAEADFIFYYTVIAGCIAMALISMVGLTAIMYCIYMQHQDDKLQAWIKKAEADRPKTQTTAAKEKDGKNDAMHALDMDMADVDVDVDVDVGMAFDF